MPAKTTNKPAPRSRKAKRTKSGAKTDAPPRKVPRQRAKAAKPRGARAGTKQALLIDLLKRKTGASIADLVKATSWQPHSVRGAISGTLKRKLGLTVTSEPIEKRGRVYRIVGRGWGRTEGGSRAGFAVGRARRGVSRASTHHDDRKA